MPDRRSRRASARRLILTLALVLCVPVLLPAQDPTPTPAPAGPSFEEFLAGVRADALKAGIRPATLDAALTATKGDAKDATALASALASTTSKTPSGDLAFDPTTHAATLDEISEGRVILGLGTSGKMVVENFHGVPYVKPLTRLRETVGIMRALWRGDRLSPEMSTLFDARHFKLEMKNTFNVSLPIARPAPSTP